MKSDNLQDNLDMLYCDYPQCIGGECSYNCERYDKWKEYFELLEQEPDDEI